jgi:hypothetical protein
MSDPTPPLADPPTPPVFPGRTLIALAVVGVLTGASLTLAVLHATDPESLRQPPTAAPAPPLDDLTGAPARAAPPSPLASSDMGKRLHALAETLADDDARRALYAANPALQDEYSTPQAWGAAAAALHDRLVALPEAANTDGGLEIRSKEGEHGSQDIVTLTGPDGKRTVLFFEGDHLVSFEVP